jgi:hypothetical protein
MISYRANLFESLNKVVKKITESGQYCVGPDGIVYFVNAGENIGDFYLMSEKGNVTKTTNLDEINKNYQYTTPRPGWVTKKVKDGTRYAHYPHRAGDKYEARGADGSYRLIWISCGCYITSFKNFSKMMLSYRAATMPNPEARKPERKPSSITHEDVLIKDILDDNNQWVNNDTRGPGGY